MENNCTHCKFFEPHKRAHYPRGKCLKQFAFRIPDGFKIYLDIMTPAEFICDYFENIPKPIYAIIDGETYIVPRIIADGLIRQGWVAVRIGDGMTIKKDEGEDNA